MTTTTVYDSAEQRLPFLTTFKHFWEYRDLIKLLTVKNVTARYKRSVLGVWWTLLNPILTTLIYFVVFEKLFGRDSADEFPYLIYLISGIIVAGFFSEAVIACGSAIVGSRGILQRMQVPPEVFSFAAAIAAAVNFVISVVPLVAAMVLLGVEIPWNTVFLAVIPAAFLLLLVTGLGLIVASAAVFFYDVIDFVKVLTQLISLGSASFFSLSWVSERYQPIIKANPLFHYIDMFRKFFYRGEMPDALNWMMVVGSAVLALGLGAYVFSRSWKNLVVRL
ncbi:MAG: ABC transporter permease [Acidimicrobiia bacterium]|nr:ABC transporter permease [Acidimicrobiia bacterium]NNC43748.1 ABC transporter permease [Acidimicrobiia bacterium]NND13971.1 ABC transporter permease [Acidimicrobiia bacterium]